MTQFVEQLRNQAKWYAQPGHNARDLMDSRLLEKAADEIECLRAKIERMEKQEPVAEIGQQYTLLFAGSGPIAGVVKRHGLKTGDKLYARPGAQSAPSIMDAIIDDLQSQFDSEGITEYDSGDALIRLSGAIAAVEDNFAGAQPAQGVPDGWKLTPINPDHQMLTAGNRWANGLAYETYVAMITAAPETKP